MINSHLLYRLSYRGTTARMLLIKKEKSILCRDIYVVGIRGVQQWRRRRGFSRDSSGGSRLKPLLQGLAVYTKTPAYEPAFLFIAEAYSTACIARVTLSRLPLFSAATQMRPVPTA
jgi:hypothetical protein